MVPSAQVQERGRRLVEEMAGVALEGRDLPGLAAAMAREMARLGVSRPADYVTHLEGDGAAADRASLVDLVVNNETYFFREPQHFAALRSLLIDRGDDGGPAAGRVRVLSAGCSTGEEAYSLAIELLQLQARVPTLDFEVLGADISQRALEVARLGVYGPNSFRRLPDGLCLEAWMEPVGEGTWSVSEQVRRLVSFHSLNLKDEEALGERVGPVDVVFFRNVLIYLSPATRRQVCRNLVATLRRRGCLFIATPESIPPDVDGLGRRHLDGVAYWEKGAADANRPVVKRDDAAPGAVAAEWPSPPRAATVSRAATAAAPRPASGSARRGNELGDLCARAMACAREDRAQEAMGLLRQITAAVPDHPEACRLMAELHLDRAEFEQAVELSDRATGRDQSLAWPYVVRGRIAHNTGEGAAAMDELRRAIYYRPDWWPAHFFLAEAYREQGEMPLARRAYENALHNLERRTDPGQDCGADFIGYSREDIAVTCRINLQDPRGRTEEAP